MGSDVVTVEMNSTCFELPYGENLLESLLNQGAFVRHGCRAGVCGACRLYDQQNCDSILSCQTSVMSDMSLTTQTPSASSVFTVLSKRTLSDSVVELTLLGPSDESFGDRVSVSFSVEDESVFTDCMALNQAGSPLVVLIQKAVLSALAWQQVLLLTENASINVTLSSGVRKGRLLFEMDVAESPVVVISSSSNGVFESYWRDALVDCSVQYLGCFSLLSNDKPNQPKPSVSLTDDAFIAFLSDALANAGSGVLQIIYHGQKISAKDWEQSLRPLRIRMNQLHFVR
ncbi:2Fe-2S iron-sulfur cluster-binding protein [Marinomonas sp. IMCC 4694]|uniref:2Fe-2S iron-sulfur cluster-binding protein n=1 Tax=Marinomonas sp. IMCC 4694 TaxID=2605432 RepID=UPI0011E87666|nr:2Fe-2S iron-sulfur cluster-binding protein [Marinomonas sp. IMCC 4694]TYL48032.1 (2Fe-2S)-binding protein [Marinomonas sp. IMCC 4694]